MAVYAMRRRKYPLSDPHGYELDAGRAAKLAGRIAGAAPQSLLIDPRISLMRSEIMPDAAVLLQTMPATLKPHQNRFSSRRQRADPLSTETTRVGKDWVR